MEERIDRCLEVEVPVAKQVELGVGREEGCGEPRDCRGVERRNRVRDECEQVDHDHHHCKGGQEPLDPPSVEPAESDPPERFKIGEQRRGDHEPRDHKEHVDAGESARYMQSGVVEDDEEHGDAAKALDVEPPTVSAHRVHPSGGSGIGSGCIPTVWLNTLRPCVSLCV